MDFDVYVRTQAEPEPPEPFEFNPALDESIAFVGRLLVKTTFHGELVVLV